jgi:hypothetical protein
MYPQYNNNMLIKSFKKKEIPEMNDKVICSFLLIGQEFLVMPAN